jgi:hypothetical protein
LAVQREQIGRQRHARRLRRTRVAQPQIVRRPKDAIGTDPPELRVGI